MDSTLTGLNPDQDSTPNGLNPDWDSTLTETELRMGLNLEFLSTSNMVYNVYIYQKSRLKKRENTDQSISVKKRLSGPHTYTS
jgi:hypothetical protein